MKQTWTQDRVQDLRQVWIPEAPVQAWARRLEQDRTRQDQDRRRQDQDRVQNQDRTKQDQDRRRQDQDRVRQEQDRARQDQDRTEQDQDRTRQDQDRIPQGLLARVETQEEEVPAQRDVQLNVYDVYGVGERAPELIQELRKQQGRKRKLLPEKQVSEHQG